MDLIFFLHQLINMLIAQIQFQSFEQTKKECSIASYFVSHIVAKRIRAYVCNITELFTCLFLCCCMLAYICFTLFYFDHFLLLFCMRN
jgi:hypothetical protein